MSFRHIQRTNIPLDMIQRAMAGAEEGTSALNHVLGAAKVYGISTKGLRPAVARLAREPFE